MSADLKLCCCAVQCGTNQRARSGACMAPIWQVHPMRKHSPNNQGAAEHHTGADHCTLAGRLALTNLALKANRAGLQSHDVNLSLQYWCLASTSRRAHPWLQSLPPQYQLPLQTRGSCRCSDREKDRGANQVGNHYCSSQSRMRFSVRQGQNTAVMQKERRR